MFVGNLIARGLGFLFPVLIANLLDRPDFAVAMFLVSTGFFAGELVLTGFPTAMTRAIAADPNDRGRPGWIVGAVLGGIPLLILSGAIGWVLADRGDAPGGLLLLVIVGLTIDAYYFALLRGLRRFGWLAVYRVAANLAQLVLVVLLAIGGTVAVTPVVLVYGFVYVLPILVIEVVDGPARRAVRGSLDGLRRRLGPLTRFAVPALITGTAYGAILGFDVFFVRIFAPTELADYAAARSLALPMMLVPFALAVVLLPQAAAAATADSGRLLRRALVIAIAAAAAAWLGYVLLGELVIEAFFPPDYASAREPLMVLAPAVAILGIYSILSGWTMGIGRPWTTAVCLGIGAIVTIVGHLLITSSAGSIGAGVSMAMGASTALVLIAIATWRYLRGLPATAPVAPAVAAAEVPADTDAAGIIDDPDARGTW